jgi:hypothetical protein
MAICAVLLILIIWHYLHLSRYRLRPLLHMAYLSPVSKIFTHNENNLFYSLDTMKYSKSQSIDTKGMSLLDRHD